VGQGDTKVTEDSGVCQVSLKPTMNVRRMEREEGGSLRRKGREGRRMEKRPGQSGCGPGRHRGYGGQWSLSSL
jgi:hypothetical protein